ncbi:crossover junction endodeoxyribonuclease RuvC [Acidobacteriota bacterium]
MKVLGIDPSLKSTGYGLIEYTDQEYSVWAYGTIKPKKDNLFHHKLNEIKIKIEELIDTYKPEEVAIENTFYAQNVKTALILGQVRGAALIAISTQDLPLFEYSPLEIKKSVTGYGQADKNQVSLMIRTLLNITDNKMETDASDALGAAFCHLNSRLFQQKIEESI